MDQGMIDKPEDFMYCDITDTIITPCDEQEGWAE